MFIIGITGGTGSGKTTLVSKLTAHFKEEQLSVISQDSYYKKTDNLSEEERIALNFDHPNAIDFDLLSKQLQQLKNKETIAQPIYSFLTHNRTLETKKTTPRKIIIVEGILIFNDKRILDLFDLTIFVDADANKRLKRRIKRDAEERGRSREEVTTRYQATLKPMHDLYIEPFKKSADFIFDNTMSNTSIPKEIFDIIEERINKHS
jgi:uridine kinase